MFGSYLAKTFPGVRITSGYRDPNSPLGRANPSSYHNIGKAWDVAPIKGMTFGDYVNRVKGDGWNILESRDEVNNPSSHATGPHWHIAVEGSQPMGMFGAKPKINQSPAYVDDPQVTNPYQVAPQNLISAFGKEAMNAPNLAPGQYQEWAPSYHDSLGPTAQLTPNTDALGTPQHISAPFFSKDGGWKNVLGAISDGLIVAGGGQPQYSAHMDKLEDRTAEEKQWQAQLAAKANEQRINSMAELQKSIMTKQWEREHPAPTALAQNVETLRRYNPNLTDAQIADIMTQNITRPISVNGESYGYTASPQPAAMAPGTAVDGYIYMGGDPGSQSSWRKQ